MWHLNFAQQVHWHGAGAAGAAGVGFGGARSFSSSQKTLTVGDFMMNKQNPFILSFCIIRRGTRTPTNTAVAQT